MPTTPYASTLTFLESPVPNLAISGRDSALPPFCRDFWML